METTRRTIARTALGLGLLLGAAATAGAVSARDSEEAEVRVALEAYMKGHATGQGAHHQRAFHPRANLYFVRDGQFTEITSADYIARSPGKPAPDEASRKRSIEMIDIAGDAAVAKIVLDYPDVRFTDYMSLLKVDGEWRIVAKTFHAERGAK